MPRTRARRQSTAERRSAKTQIPTQIPTGMQSLPVLVLVREAETTRNRSLVAALRRDPRFEPFVIEELTPAWVSFARRIAGTILVCEADPFRTLAYAATAGLENLVVLMHRQFASDAGALLSAGAVACATIPLGASDFDRIASVLHTSTVSTRVDSTLRLLLDPIGRTVRYQGRSIQLSQRAFALLHCLSAANGRALSAETILMCVWGESETVERTRPILEVYVCQLRRKLGQLGLAGALTTVRRFGYGLGAPARVPSESLTNSPPAGTGRHPVRR